MLDQEFSDGDGVCLDFNCYLGRVVCDRLGNAAKDAGFNDGSIAEAAQEQR